MIEMGVIKAPIINLSHRDIFVKILISYIQSYSLLEGITKDWQYETYNYKLDVQCNMTLMIDNYEKLKLTERRTLT